MILAPQQALYNLLKPFSEGSEAVLSEVYRDIKDSDSGYPYAIIHNTEVTSENQTQITTRYTIVFSVVISTERSGKQGMTQQEANDAHYTAVSEVLEVLNNERRKEETLENSVDFIEPITVSTETLTQEVPMIQTTITLNCVIIKSEV